MLTLTCSSSNGGSTCVYEEPGCQGSVKVVGVVKSDGKACNEDDSSTVSWNQSSRSRIRSVMPSGRMKKQ